MRWRAQRIICKARSQLLIRVSSKDKTLWRKYCKGGLIGVGGGGMGQGYRESRTLFVKVML